MVLPGLRRPLAPRRHHRGVVSPLAELAARVAVTVAVCVLAGAAIGVAAEAAVHAIRNRR